jgi:inward rectifier potassium channel
MAADSLNSGASGELIPNREQASRELATTEAGNRDLGFGRVLSQQEVSRLLNRDGTFNVSRHQTPGWRRLLSYHGMLTISWPAFFAVLSGGYGLLNLAFAVGFWLCGPQALEGATVQSNYWRAFFFSVDTFATIGYGNMEPVGYAANILVTFEAIIGLLSFALATGLIFSRFARPTAQILYSRNAIIAPYQGVTAFEFRVVNGRPSELTDLSASIVLSRFEEQNGIRQRRYYPLTLERNRVAFFPLAWTIVHPIDPSSPLYGYDEQRMKESRAEFLILLTGTDEAFAQTVHSRSSYAADEVLWGMRFANLFRDGKTVPTIDLERFHTVEVAS